MLVVLVLKFWVQSGGSSVRSESYNESCIEACKPLCFVNPPLLRAAPEIDEPHSASSNSNPLHPLFLIY
jgi:hypothetical protein